MHIVTRAEWGARSPRDTTYVPWSKRDRYIQHYSAASKYQSVRAIQNYHMDVRGWVDIGYNFLCDWEGTLYEGRGWTNLGTHTVGYNTSGIACCFIGTNADVTDNAKKAMRWLYLEANRRKGATLKKYGHRDLDQTSCPGDRLWNWVHSGMPIPAEPVPVPPPASKARLLGVPVMLRFR